jgi:hypothetical protein
MSLSHDALRAAGAGQHPVNFTYRAYGLTIQVPFACPALTPADAGPAADAADVVVREHPVPRRLSARRSGAASWDAAPGEFLLRGGQRSGRFLVGAGAVMLERNPECDDAVLARHFTDQVLAALLRLRGLLVLHANAVQTPDGVVVIGGASGSGKSTTLAALLRRGCRMLSDDVTALRPGGTPGVIEVVPGVAQVHLTEDAAEGLGYAVHPAQLQPWRRMKAVISVRDSMTGRAGQLRALYVLRPSGGDEVVAARVAGRDKFLALQGCLYGPMFAEEHPALLPLMSAVVAAVPFYRLDRPASRWSVHEVAEMILASPSPDRAR